MTDGGTDNWPDDSALAAARLWPDGVRVLAPETAAAEGAARVHSAPGLDHLPMARRVELAVHAAELAAWIDLRVPESGRCRVVGISGGQGSGKSTLAALAAEALEQRGLRTLVLSLDDLYLGRDERGTLAEAVHPLLATRGPPGTHDVRIGRTLLDALRAGARDLPLPCFDKVADDRMARSEWQRLEVPVDVVLFEGWCIGAEPQSEAALVDPVNELEAREDPDALWRRFVNRALEQDYRPLFAGLDALVMLRVPDLAAVRRWRREQEAQLRARRGGGMTPEQVDRFVDHYERLTRHMLRTLPARAELVLSLDADHAVVAVQGGFSGDGAASPS